MTKNNNLTDFLTGIATKLRTKLGYASTTKINPQNFESEIDKLTYTHDADATDAHILSGKTAYVDGAKVTGTIATKTSSSLTASGATVSVPAGYYASAASKSVSTGSAKTPATTITKNPTISVNSSGLITASVSGTQSVTPTVTAGYVSSGTAGTITVSGSATSQLTTKAAATITPTTSNQTIAAGTYCSGAQTIAGDADLVAKNIRKGVNIFNVAGTYDGLVGENLRGKTVLFYFANVDNASNMPSGYHFYVDNNNYIKASMPHANDNTYWYWDDIYIGGQFLGRDSCEPTYRMFTHTFPNDKDYIVTAYDNHYFMATIVNGVIVPKETDVPAPVNLKGRTLTFRSVMDATYGDGNSVTVFKVSNSDYIEIDTYNGYYQGYGLFQNIYDTNNFSGIRVTFPSTQDYIISVNKGFVAYS